MGSHYTACLRCTDSFGPAEGAIIVHQEDNAPPHQEGDFHAWPTAEFEKRGWRLELQAPQGPYPNVLDLQVVLHPYPV
jgi:hypothetical protein